MIDLPSLALVIATAIIDSINPMAVGLLILLISILLGQRNSTRRLTLLISGYILGVGIIYFGLGLGFGSMFKQMSALWSQNIAILFGVLVTLTGVIHIKDFFWYGKGFSIRTPTFVREVIEQLSKKHKSLIGLFLLGGLAGLAELIVSGAPYFGIIAALETKSIIELLIYLLVYSITFIVPLVIIMVIASRGTKISTIAKWKDESKQTLRLLSGFLLSCLGWLLILIANDSINFG